MDTTQTASDHAVPLQPAYDLREAALACRKLALRAKQGLAWMEDGQLRFGFKSGPSNWKVVPCMMCSSGGEWWMWEAEKVSHALLNEQNVPQGEGWNITPLEHSIFDPEENEAVWFGPRDQDAQLKELTHCGEQVRSRLAHLEEQLTQLGVGDGSSFPSTFISEISLQKERVQAHLKALDLAIQFLRPGELDVCTAFNQGRRIERALCRLEALAANAPYLTVTAQQGASGQRLSGFWRWVLATYPSGNPKDIFNLLDKQEDPERAGTIMRIEGLSLIRTVGRPISMTSFQQKFQRLRARERRRQGNL